jgi:nucleoside phosphorylase
VSWNPDPRFSGAPAAAATVPELCVLTALASEAESLVACSRAELGLVPAPAEIRRLFLAPSRDVWVGYTGLGREAVRATFAALSGERAPRRVVYAGVAGALRGDLATGDLVLLEGALGEGREGVRTSPVLTASLATAFERAGLAFRRGWSLEIGKLAGTPDEKRELARRVPEACVADMEDHAALAAARELGPGVEVAAFRVVIDRLADNLPDLSSALDGAGRPRALQLAAHFLRRPGEITALPGLARSFGRARATLDRALSAALTI